MAEIYEGELQDYQQAIANYERAADYYKGEDSTGSVGGRGWVDHGGLASPPRPITFLAEGEP